MRHKKIDFRRNDSGFSLIELVVVIAIMAVLTGVISAGISSLTGRQAQKASKKIESILGTVKVQTMARRSVTGKLKKDGDSYVFVTTTKINNTDPATEKTDVIGGKKVKIYFSTDDAGTKQDITDSGIDIVFDRASGELVNFGAASAATADGGKYCLYIEQGSKSYTIRIYKETGKVEYN